MPGVLRSSTAAAVIALVLLSPAPARAKDSRLGFHVVHIEPSGEKSRRSSQPGWGVAFQLTMPVRGTAGLLAGVGGIEYVNMLDRVVSYVDPTSVSFVDVRTGQELGRLYVGSEIGPHAGGALRPHAGADIGLVVYGSSVEVLVSDNRPAPTRQYSRHKAAFGYDVCAGLDIVPWKTVSFDLGARYLEAFNAPQPLPLSIGEPSHTAYIQAYAAVEVSLDWLRRGVGK